jgi:parvulin-like peptidyl-prolyl isomerase
MKTLPIAVHLMAITLLFTGLLTTVAVADDAADLVLAEVNGTPITGADLERMIIESHRAGGLVGMEKGLIPRLIEKAIRDQLILQDAYAMGMDQEPDLTGPGEEKCVRKAISLYSRASVELPEISEAEVLAYFDSYYHKIRVRQISLATEEECLAMIALIDVDESMGTLAAKHSLDPMKARGGLHNDKYWADLENELRDASKGVETGQVSRPFAYREVWSFIRVESRTAVDPADLSRFEPYIRSVIRTLKYKEVWAEFVAEHEARVEIQVNEEILAALHQDEAMLYRGEFKLGTEVPVLAIDPGHFVTENQFREAMSHEAMGMGEADFAEILDHTVKLQREFLVLSYFAEQAGYFEDPEVVQLYDGEIARVVLNTYLEEHIGSRIKFTRAEFDEFYREHQEEFRGDEEIRMSILTSTDQTVIRDADTRLKEGADFDYLRAEIEGRDISVLAETASWSPVTVFSDQIIAAAEGLEVGETSGPLPFGEAWLIFRLDGRREGSVKPIEEVDGAIRQAIYVRKFSELLDEHLARLEEVSVIVRHEERIRAWADSES